MNQAWRVLVLLIVLTACAPGSTLNPLQLRGPSSFAVKAGSSTSLRIFTGSTPNLGISPAELYSRNQSGFSLSGSNTTFAFLGLAQLSGSVLPSGWQLELRGDGIDLIGRATSAVTGYDTINTVTRIELGEYRLEAHLDVPSDTALGNYSVKARVDVRGKGPVSLDWVVQVVAP
jgi:hypothetical protein